MCRIVSLALVGMLAATAGAQDPAALPSGVEAGARVRASSPRAKTVVGRVVGVSGDTLRVLRDGTRDTASVSIARLTALDLSTDRHKRRWSGAGIGLAAGMVLGAAVGGATYKSHNCTGDFCDVWGPWPNVVVGAVLLGSAGAITGAVLGNGMADSWSPLMRNGARVGLGLPGPGREVGVVASVRF